MACGVTHVNQSTVFVLGSLRPRLYLILVPFQLDLARPMYQSGGIGESNANASGTKTTFNDVDSLCEAITKTAENR